MKKFNFCIFGIILLIFFVWGSQYKFFDSNKWKDIEIVYKNCLVENNEDYAFCNKLQHPNKKTKMSKYLVLTKKLIGKEKQYIVDNLGLENNKRTDSHFFYDLGYDFFNKKDFKISFSDKDLVLKSEIITH